jgi:hypothetical protein
MSQPSKKNTNQRGRNVAVRPRSSKRSARDLGRDGTRPDVFVIGEDVGAYGGAFKVTDGLIDSLAKSE